MVEYKKDTFTFVDPPSGYLYGFPKALPLDFKGNEIEWIVENGYPSSNIEEYGDHFTYGVSQTEFEYLKVSKNNTITIRSVEKKNNFNRLEVIALLDKFNTSEEFLEVFVEKYM